MAKKTLSPSEKRIRTLRRNKRNRRFANGEKPLHRLLNDGGADPANINRRLRWLAGEWKIPLDEVPTAYHSMTRDVYDFVQRYRIDVHLDVRTTIPTIPSGFL
jgi:hypothetical protein